MGNLGVSKAKKRIDPTSMLIIDPIIGMNLSSSQMELVQSWGLGHSDRPKPGQAYFRENASLGWHYPTLNL